MSDGSSVTNVAYKSKSASSGATRIDTRRNWAEEGTPNRKQQILDVARRILITEGYSNFSLRGIAAGSGVSLRTVQHHYKSKSNLMESVLWDTVSGYDELPQNYRNRTQKDAGSAFTRNLQAMLADTHCEETAGFFYQLWSYAYYHAEGAKVCNAVYEEHVSRISDMMKPLNPRIGSKKRKQRAVVVAALIDGMMIVNGYGRKPIADSAGIENEVINVALRLAKEA